MSLDHSISLEDFIDPLLRLNGNNENFDLSEILTSDTADAAARLFFSYINSTLTISSSYALVIILAGSLGLLALLGLVQLLATTIITGTTIHSYSGKRSLPDTEESILNLNWTHIIQNLYQTGEHFKRMRTKILGDESRTRLICKFIEDQLDNLENNEQKLQILNRKLGDIYEKRVKTSFKYLQQQIKQFCLNVNPNEVNGNLRSNQP